MNIIITTIEADAQLAIARVEAGLHFLEDEGKKVIAWVDKSVPGAQTAMAQFVQTAETDAAALAQLSAKGLADVIEAAAPEIETLLGNMISATGVAAGPAGLLQQIDVSGVTTLETIGKGLITTGLTKVLAGLSQGPSGAPKPAE